MDVRVKFLGGAGTVTGSKYLLEIDDFKLLIDCGLFQGLKELRLQNWDDFPIPPSEIDAVVLTHAHIDHSGYLPRLVKQGFGGPVYCTSPTLDLVTILLTDSAKLQEEEAAYAAKKGYSKHADPKPLYNSEDVKMVIPMLRSSDLNEEIKINEKISLHFLYAGHILGASSVYLKLKGDHQTKSILFSGDLGRYDHPIFYDPVAPPSPDILFIESTYGNRVNNASNVEDDFADALNEARRNGGCTLIPAFAVGRTQEVLYYIKKLLDDGKIESQKVYVDSPMAIDATRLYVHHPSYHRLTDADLHKGDNFLHFKELTYCQTQESSMALNEIKSGAIIISASGMLAGGRILHHLYHRLPRENDTLLFTGFQAEGTRGRDIQAGNKEVKIFGLSVPVNCNHLKIDGLSAHADQPELLRWASSFAEKPKMTFLVHGEKESAQELSNILHEKLEWNTVIPEYLESVQLFTSI